MSDRFADLVGQVDVAFVIDTTGSMAPFIDAARQHVREIAEEIGRDRALDLQLAVVEYRDHPPQEESFVTRSYPFGDGGELQAVLQTLRPHGGGDNPEAVLDGLLAAAALQWRPEADHLCFLVGDAPPHGAAGLSPEGSLRTRAGDAWPEGCPCRATPNGVVEVLRGHRIRLHAITLVRSSLVERAFGELAEGTGGSLTRAPHDPIAAVASTRARLKTTADDVDSARRYMAMASSVGSTDPSAVAPAMGTSKAAAERIADYLRWRGLLKRDGKE